MTHDTKRIRKIKACLGARNQEGVLKLLNEYPPIPIDFENNYIWSKMKSFSDQCEATIKLIGMIWDNFTPELKETHITKITLYSLSAEGIIFENRLPFLEKVLDAGYRPDFFKVIFDRTFNDIQNQILAIYLAQLLSKYYDLELEINKIRKDPKRCDFLVSQNYLLVIFELCYIQNPTLMADIPYLRSCLAYLLLNNISMIIKIKYPDYYQKLNELLPQDLVIYSIFRFAPDIVYDSDSHDDYSSPRSSILQTNSIANMEIEDPLVKRNTELLMGYTITWKDVNYSFSAGPYIFCVDKQPFEELIISNSELPDHQFLSTSALNKIVTDLFIDFHLTMFHLSWAECIHIFLYMCPWFEKFINNHNLYPKLMRIHSYSRKYLNTI